MQIKDLIVFRNSSGFDEPIIKTGLGELSLRNIIVVSIFGGISMAIFKLLIPINFEIADNPILAIVTIIPILIGLSLAFIKPQFGSTDSNILSLILIHQRNKKLDKRTVNISKTKSEKSKILGFGAVLKSEKSTNENTIKEFTCSDFDEEKRLKITLYRTDGELYSNNLVKCYINDNLIDNLRTSLDGVLIVIIKPETEGKRS